MQDIQKDGPKRFSPAQLESLFVRSMGDILCDNSDVAWMRKKVFLMDSHWLRCGHHNRLELGLFLPSKRALVHF